MTTLVIGAGLLGLCTAKALVDRGESVTILESREGVALETSYANGGMITPSLPEPWNDPGVHRHLAASLFDPKSAMKLHLHAIPSLFFWGIRFLRNSAPSRYYRACEDNFLLATYSLGRIQELMRESHLDFSHGTGGTLSVFRNEKDLLSKKIVSDRLALLGMRYELLDSNGIVEVEPTLEDVRHQLVAGIYFPDDEFGDAQRFCVALAGILVNAGARIETATPVSEILHIGGRVTGVRAGEKDFPAKRVVLAAGPQSCRLARTVGMSLPVRPAKGYSVTIDVSGIDGTPRIPVLDDTMHAGMTPLDHRLRLVGTAEFTGFDTRIEQVRVDNLFDLLQALYPSVNARVDRTRAVPWAGLRPMSADGKPIIGGTSMDGLYLNTGHGQLGWTMAMGSAELLADLMLGSQPAIDPAPFSFDRK